MVPSAEAQYYFPNLLYFNFFTDLADNFILQSNKDRFINAMLVVPCVNAIIETAHDVCFNPFA